MDLSGEVWLPVSLVSSNNEQPRLQNERYVFSLALHLPCELVWVSSS